MRSARFSHIVLRNKTNVSEFLEVTRPPADGVSSSSAEDKYSPPSLQAFSHLGLNYSGICGSARRVLLALEAVWRIPPLIQ